MTPEEFLKIKNAVTELKEGVFLRFGLGTYTHVCMWLDEYAEQSRIEGIKDGFAAAIELKKVDLGFGDVLRPVYFTVEDYLKQINM